MDWAYCSRLYNKRKQQERRSMAQIEETNAKNTKSSNLDEQINAFHGMKGPYSFPMNEMYRLRWLHAMTTVTK
eukprot:scaffold660859_cov86-Prasinocladus_malaysianus.AAC.1